MNTNQIKDKAVFVLGLLGVFLAFSPFKEDLSQINLFIINKKYSLSSLMIAFLLPLTLSVYLYALDYLKYSLGRHQNFFIFKIFVPLANFFYFIAILFPLLVVSIWLISFPVINDFFIQYNLTLISTFIIVGFFIIYGFLISMRLTTEMKAEEISIIEGDKNKYLQRAIQLLNNHFYGESISEAFKALELWLRERLLEDKKLSTSNIPTKDLIYLAFQNKIINDKDIKIIEDIHKLRNKAAHSITNITKEQSFSALKIIKEILNS